MNYLSKHWAVRFISKLHPRNRKYYDVTERDSSRVKPARRLNHWRIGDPKQQRSNDTVIQNLLSTSTSNKLGVYNLDLLISVQPIYGMPQIMRFISNPICTTVFNCSMLIRMWSTSALLQSWAGFPGPYRYFCCHRYSSPVIDCM